MNTPKITIIMPVYNEQATAAQAVRQAAECLPSMAKEIIVVNDGSTDATASRVRSLGLPGITVIDRPRNEGKGAAVRAAIARMTGDVAVILDADLEYSTDDLPALIKPIIDDKADAVYGTRLLGGSGPHRVLFFWHYVANRFLTTVSNALTNLNLSDIEVGLKAFRADALRQIELREDRFGFEPEVTAKAARLHLRIFEVPISYYGRTYKEGKKIRWHDGLSALWCILRYSIFG